MALSQNYSDIVAQCRHRQYINKRGCGPLKFYNSLWLAPYANPWLRGLVVLPHFPCSLWSPEKTENEKDTAVDKIYIGI